jgi:hypothetical protein
MARLAAACALLIAPGLAAPASAEASPPPPVLDCKLGFAGLHDWATWLPGAQQKTVNGRDIVIVEDPEVWRVHVIFSAPGEPGHPVVALRKFVKQVTGVWTAQSMACGFGNPAQFAGIFARLKAEDTSLTDASRAEAERQKQSPLGAP